MLQTDGFCIDLILSTQGSLSILLFEALCPQITLCTSCHALGHVVPLFLCTLGVALASCNTVLHYFGHFWTEKTTKNSVYRCHVKLPKSLRQPLFSGNVVNPLLRAGALSKVCQLEVRLLPVAWPQCRVCLCKLLVDKREIEELVYTLLKFLLNLIFEGPNY